MMPLLPLQIEKQKPHSPKSKQIMMVAIIRNNKRLPKLMNGKI
jgi:hypothetical protein